MIKRGLLVVLSGPSGVGKDTVAKQLTDMDERFAVSVSATSRPPRGQEEEGVAYFFVKEEKFLAMAERGEFLEYAVYNGNYYGTLREQVERLRAQGKHVLLTIEGEGARSIRKTDPDALLIFLMAPSWEALCKRLAGRCTESPEDVAARLDIAKKELEFARQYDYIAVNDKVEEAAKKICSIVEAAECRTEHQLGFLRRVLEDAQAIHVPDYRQE